MTGARVLDVRGLTSARRPPVLVDVDLTADRGQGTAVVCPSGGGKTALLRAILGLDGTARGSIAWFGVVCEGAGQFRAARRRLGVVFEDGGLLGSSPVDVNIAWGLGRRGRGAHRAEVGRLLDLLDLRADALPEQLTPWERKRVGLGRALAARPEVVLVDGLFDPWLMANLDAVLATVYAPDLPLPTRIMLAAVVPNSEASAERLVLLGSHGTVMAGPRDEVLGSVDPDVQMLLGHFAMGDG